jgi:hypothetical protein
MEENSAKILVDTLDNYLPTLKVSFH